MKIVILALACGAMLSGCSVKPEPLTFVERQAYIDADNTLQQKHVIPSNGLITLPDAMARIIASNIDYRIQAMEQALAHDEFEKAKLDMLPDLRAMGAYTYRDPRSASKSMNLKTGEVSTGGYTTSEDQGRALGDITFSWNLLDLGLSYYQAKQQADAVLVRREMQRSVMQSLLFKVRHTYWNAWFAQQFTPEVELILTHANKALEDSRTIEAKRLMPSMQALQYQRALYDIINQLESLLAQMQTATVELRSLMNLPYTEPMTLEAPGDPTAGMLPATFPEMSDLLEMALHQRPESRQSMYRSRSSLFEVKKAILRTLPGLEIRTALNYDGNSFLRDNMWWNVWGTVTANVVDMLTTPQRMRVAKSGVELADYRRLGVHLAIITQVQLSLQQYNDTILSMQRAQEISAIDGRILKLLSTTVDNAAASQLDEIRQQASTLYSRLSHSRAYAEAQNAYGRILNSLGVDMLPEQLDNMSYAQLLELLQNTQTLENISINAAMEDFQLKKEQAKAQAETDDASTPAKTTL